jgi:hypothetical protein
MWKPICEAPFWNMLDSPSPGECLVYSEEFGVKMGRAWRYPDGEAFADANGFHGDWKITHFHELPEPPK